MRDQQVHRARIVASIAATVISLACGTNYVYSAWAPQFADRLKLSSTESNLVGLSGNLGMYSMGIPVGMFVDTRGPRPAVMAGAFLLGLGYFPLHQAYDSASGSVPLLCFFSYLTGLGGCMAFAASVKTSALNWPHHRGTATAFPLAAFGLSAFFFSVFGGLFFPGDPSAFLMILACGTFGLTFVGFFFLRVLPHPASYHAVPSHEGLRPALSDSQQLRRTSSEEAKRLGHHRAAAALEPGMSPTDPPPAAAQLASGAGEGAGAAMTPDPERATATLSGDEEIMPTTASPAAGTLDDPDVDESSSLISSSNASSLPGDILVQSSVDMDRSHRVDIRGVQLLRVAEFWEQFAIMGILTGIGLMTINNIGNDVTALWRHFDDSVDDAFLIHRQQMHVSILSVCSFSGRLLSGVGSDFLVKVLHASRVWCLVLASLIFSVAQICALNIENPNFLGFVSGLSGLGYGFLFGVFPSIVAESFGIHGLSQNWGFMTLSPVISGNVFNLFYGLVYDQHSIIGPGGERSCLEGLQCYRAAYFVTLGACALGLLVTLLVIRNQRVHRAREAKDTED